MYCSVLYVLCSICLELTGFPTIWFSHSYWSWNGSKCTTFDSIFFGGAICLIRANGQEELFWVRALLFYNQQQFISVNNCTSSTASLLSVNASPRVRCWVLSSPVHPLYILPLGNIIRWHADDVQLYVYTKSITAATHDTLITCLTQIKFSHTKLW